MARILRIRNNTNAEFYIDTSMITHVRPMVESTAIHVGSEHIVVPMPIAEVLAMLYWTTVEDWTTPRRLEDSPTVESLR